MRCRDCGYSDRVAAYKEIACPRCFLPQQQSYKCKSCGTPNFGDFLVKGKHYNGQCLECGKLYLDKKDHDQIVHPKPVDPYKLEHEKAKAQGKEPIFRAPKKKTPSKKPTPKKTPTKKSPKKPTKKSTFGAFDDEEREAIENTRNHLFTTWHTPEVCAVASNHLADKLHHKGWSYKEGEYKGPDILDHKHDGGYGYGHAWNTKPDGTIIDVTADQFGRRGHHRDGVRVIGPHDPRQKWYKVDSRETRDSLDEQARGHDRAKVYDMAKAAREQRDAEGLWIKHMGNLHGLARHLIDYEPGRSLTNTKQLEQLHHILPHNPVRIYTKVPCFHAMNKSMGMIPNKRSDPKEYEAKRNAFFRAQHTEDIDTGSLTFTQPTVNKAAIDGLRKGAIKFHNPIYVARRNGQNYLMDGHHRTVAAALSGQKTMKAYVADFDNPKSIKPPDAKYEQDLEPPQFGKPAQPTSNTPKKRPALTREGFG